MATHTTIHLLRSLGEAIALAKLHYSVCLMLQPHKARVSLQEEINLVLRPLGLCLIP